MSKTVVADIRFDRFPEITVPPGTSVVWRNLDPYAHSAESGLKDPDYFNAGALLPGHTSSPISFDKPGEFDYLCRFHTGMVGRVTVAEGAVVGPQVSPEGPAGHEHGGHEGHGGGHGLQHFHGFVTGGRSADRLYMSHTPVLADTRHNYQVILQGRFEDPAQGQIYEELRASEYGHGLVQIFHGHMSMPDIGNGTIKLLPEARVSFYPDGQQKQIPGLGSVRIALDQVIHFHQFETEADHPSELTYLMYGDQDDVFVDHLINRAPSFHSVARLASAPSGWTAGTGAATEFTVPGRRMRDVPNRLLDRASIVDNGFHVFWLLPPGFLERQAQDPLIRRNLRPAPEERHPHDIRFGTGETSRIEIERFLHFDIRLLNYGVLIVEA